MATGRINDTWFLKDRKTRSKRYGIGKRWQAVWTDDLGNEEKKSFEFKDAAKAWVDNKVAANLRDPRGIKPDMLFEDFYSEWRASQIHQRENSLSSLDSHVKNWILPSMRGQGIQGIDRKSVQAAVASWSAGGNAASTVELMFSYLSMIFSDAVLDKRITETPCIKINLPDSQKPPIKPLTVEQIKMLVECFQEPWRSGLLIAAATGMRPGEWRGLTADCVDLKRKVILVEKQVATRNVASPKFGPLKTPYSHREVAIGPEAALVLQPLVEDPGVLGLVFHKGGTILTTARSASAWSKVRETRPWMGSGWHQVRHFSASRLIAGGASPVAVAHRLGHKDATETLKTYSHLWPDDDSKMADMADVGSLLAEA